MFPFPQGQVQSSNFQALGTREEQPLPKAVNKVLGGLPVLQTFPHSLFHLLCSGGSMDGEGRSEMSGCCVDPVSWHVANIVGMAHEGPILPLSPVLVDLG